MKVANRVPKYVQANNRLAVGEIVQWTSHSGNQHTGTVHRIRDFGNSMTGDLITVRLSNGQYRYGQYRSFYENDVDFQILPF